jgi:hypothetical protein
VVSQPVQGFGNAAADPAAAPSNQDVVTRHPHLDPFVV